MTGFTVTLTFIVAFGVVKAATNFFAGTLSDRYGRKPVFLAGWLIGIPVPVPLIWAPTWSWVIIANALLGVNQGLTWSTTVIMKIDLVGPAQRGLAMGFNEAAGYGAVALTAVHRVERAGVVGRFVVGVAAGFAHCERGQAEAEGDEGEAEEEGCRAQTVGVGECAGGEAQHS